jgi:hypothetical protein
MKNFIQKIILPFTIALSLLAPQVATAQTTVDRCKEAGTLRDQLNRYVGNTPLPAYCTPEALYNKIIRMALYAIGIVAVIALIYGGYHYMTAGANEERRKKAKTVLTWAVIGLIVVIMATLLVNTVVRLLVDN